MKLIQDLGKKEYGTKGLKESYGIYECPICKKHFETSSRLVKRGQSTKCKECKCTANRLSTTKLYPIFTAIISRTNNKDNKGYCNYGARGISICDEWKNDFISFYNWCIENGYKEGLSIDRIDNDGNYEPSNCRFVNRCTQARNTRILIKTNTSGYTGVSYYKQTQKWKAQIKVNNKKIGLGYYKSIIDAGYAYDKYVIDNNLEHTTNGLIERLENVEK